MSTERLVFRCLKLSHQYVLLLRDYCGLFSFPHGAVQVQRIAMQASTRFLSPLFVSPGEASPPNLDKTPNASIFPRPSMVGWFVSFMRMLPSIDKHVHSFPSFRLLVHVAYSIIEKQGRHQGVRVCPPGVRSPPAGALLESVLCRRKRCQRRDDSYGERLEREWECGARKRFSSSSGECACFCCTPHFL